MLRAPVLRFDSGHQKEFTPDLIRFRISGLQKQLTPELQRVGHRYLAAEISKLSVLRFGSTFPVVEKN